MDDEKKYVARIERVVARWAGQRVDVSRRETAEAEVIRHMPTVPGAADTATVSLDKVQEELERRVARLH